MLINNMMKEKEQSISKNGCLTASAVSLGANNRRAYTSLLFSPINVEIDNSILTGSVLQNTPIKNTVTVKPYENGFDPNDGFTEDDWTITFE